MSDYERNTVLSIREVFSRADEVFTERGDLQRTRESRHSLTYSGGEGTVTVNAHRHGPLTTVIVSTNQLRTSKLDAVARYMMNQLPYQHNDPERE